MAILLDKTADSSHKEDTVVDMPLVQTAQQLSADPFPFARSYQLDALEMAMEKNTIVFLETGSGKTLIAIMLLRSYAHLLRKPSSSLAVFLVPTVVLVSQQAEVVEMHTDLKVGKYWGEMGVDFWKAAEWKKQQDEYEVLVMTPQILLNALRHSFIKLETIKILIFDECHHARGRHPYACIMTEFYHRQAEPNNLQLPRILGMTASPINTKGSSDEVGYWKQIQELENLMNSKVFTVSSESVVAEYIAMSTPKLKSYRKVDVPYSLFENIASDLKTLRVKFERDIEKANIEESQKENTRQRLSKLCATFFFCLSELGLWLAIQAADSLSSQGNMMFVWEKLDKCGERIITDFSLDVFKVLSGYMPSDPDWSISDDMEANVGKHDKEVFELYITTAPIPDLNEKLNVFGRVIRGEDVVQEIEEVDTDEHYRPKSPIGIFDITLEQKGSEDAKKLVNQERVFACAEIESARAVVQRIEEALDEQEKILQNSGNSAL